MRQRLRALPPRAARALARVLDRPNLPGEPTLLAHALGRMRDAELLAIINRSRTAQAADLLERLTGASAHALLSRSNLRPTRVLRDHVVANPFPRVRLNHHKSRGE